MAKAIIAGSTGFQYRAEIRRLHTPADTFSLSILTTFEGSKDPQAERQVFQVTTDAAGLRALADLVRREAS
jgi:hypothetical protein